MKILLIEDDPVGRLAMAASLKALGHTVQTATDGIQALMSFGQEPAQVVISDWHMPLLDGLGVCAEIRRQSRQYVYFILITSAVASDENHDAALAGGVDDFLTKPVAPRDLKMRLHVAERILRFTEQMHQLEDFLPICSYCKKIRDDRNYWQQIEGYIKQRTGTSFSHGVCPECYEAKVLPMLNSLSDATDATRAG